MKSLPILAVLSFLAFTARAQTEIKPEEMTKHVGDSVHVCGKVFSTRYFESAKNGPTLLNIGAPFPNQLYTVVIYNDVRPQFSFAPEVNFKDQVVCVDGRVELYKDKPQIVIHSAKQISAAVKDKLPQ
jgi:hypothetical protein